MGASLLILLAMGCSLLLGAAAIAGGCYQGFRLQQGRALWIAGGVIVSLIINSWWMVLFTILFVKFVILQEDT